MEDCGQPHVRQHIKPITAQLTYTYRHIPMAPERSTKARKALGSPYTERSTSKIETNQATPSSRSPSILESKTQSPLNPPMNGVSPITSPSPSPLPNIRRCRSNIKQQSGPRLQPRHPEPEEHRLLKARLAKMGIPPPVLPIELEIGELADDVFEQDEPKQSDSSLFESQSSLDDESSWASIRLTPAVTSSHSCGSVVPKESSPAAASSTLVMVSA